MKALLALVVLVVVSCNKKDDSPVAPTTPVVLGSYQACVNDNGASMRSTLLVSEKAIIATTITYASTDCNDLDKIFSETDIYSYLRVGINMTMSYESVVATSLNASLTSYLNTNSFCGASNWATNTPKKLINLTCEDILIHRGDILSAKMYMSNGKLVVDDSQTKQTYTQLQALNLAEAGMTLQNGTYSYYDGDRAVHLTLSSPNFQMIQYDDAAKKYYVKNGTYTSLNNVGTFTTVTNTPDCDTDENAGTPRKFQTSTFGLGLEGLEGTTWLMEKVSWTSTQFKDTFLEAGYSQACF